MATLIGWHGTNADVVRFEERFFGNQEDWSANGALGVWVYTVEGLAGMHGRRVLRVEATPATVLDVRVPELMAWDREATTAVIGDDGGGDDHAATVAWYAAKRRALLDAGVSALRVVEGDGRSMIAIILDVTTIEGVTQVSGPTRA